MKSEDNVTSARETCSGLKTRTQLPQVTQHMAALIMSLMYRNFLKSRRNFCYKQLQAVYYLMKCIQTSDISYIIPIKCDIK